MLQIDLMEFICMMHDNLGTTDTMEEIKMAFRWLRTMALNIFIATVKILCVIYSDIRLLCCLSSAEGFLFNCWHLDTYDGDWWLLRHGSDRKIQFSSVTFSRCFCVPNTEYCWGVLFRTRILAPKPQNAALSQHYLTITLSDTCRKKLRSFLLRAENYFLPRYWNTYLAVPPFPTYYLYPLFNKIFSCEKIFYFQSFWYRRRR